jgi:tetratricopeptide (TPR) repeat protein
MIHRRRYLFSAGIFVALCSGQFPATAQDIPLGVIGDWKFYNDAAWRCLNRRDYALAAERLNMAIKELRPYFPKSARLMARSYCDLARVLYHQGRYADAQPLAQWALSVRESDTKTAPEVLFQCTYTLGLIHAAQAHYADAEPLLKRAIALQEKSIGEDHLNMAVTLEHLAALYTDMQRYPQADALYRRVIAIHERTTPEMNLELAETESHYAELLRRMRQPQEADKWDTRAKGIQRVVAEKARKAKLDQASARFQGFK